MLIGNRFRPFGTLARSLTREAVIGMPERCEIGLGESSSRHFVVRGQPVPLCNAETVPSQTKPLVVHQRKRVRPCLLTSLVS